MENLIKGLVGLKVVGAVLFLSVFAVCAVYTAMEGPEDPETQHGYTAVCKDGTVLPPPWNVCGEAHGHLDHWTTAPTTTPVVQAPAVQDPLPDTDEDDWLTAYPGDCTAGTPLASPWDPCGNLP
ncbi:hypothetical protein ABZ722_11645 [Streptomyces longwoodensis]|uniref:hypothetical protein n=1 Tax=Streptomyces longwoodensis TaxID=68231 RepID=UPI0033EB4616